MKAEIITIGDELIKGDVPDTNAPFLASRLTQIGIEVARITSVGDKAESIAQAFLESLRRSEIILCTGGLGPTPDDITVEVASKALGRELVLNEELWEDIKGRFLKLGLEVTPNNKRQALMPEGAEPIPNPLGMCGFKVYHEGKILFFLPGVPKEAERMVEESIIPFLKKEVREREPIKVRTLKVFGLAESKISKLLEGILEKREDIKLAFLPRFPEVHLVISAKGSKEKEMEEMEKEIEGFLGKHIFAKDFETMESVVSGLLKKRKTTLAVAESCSGGLISHRLTNVPGSSEYFERGVVVYSNQAKIDLLAVPEDVIAEFGAVSFETAERMAQAIKDLSQTMLGLGVTGILGPTGGSPEKPVGTVFISLASPQGTTTKRYSFFGEREQIKLLASQVALNRLRRYLLGDKDEDKGPFCSQSYRISPSGQCSYRPL